MQIQIKPSKMAQWPPSPSVEDEDTALSHEHSIDALVQALKSDDQPAVDRGAVDQYPVIIDSPDLNKPSRADVESRSFQNQFSTDTCSSDDSAGPPTPPPSTKKDARRSDTVPIQNSADLPASSSSPEPPVISRGQSSSRGRPQVTRIQTDLGDDVQSMATGTRRKPSPYSYTRPSAVPNTSTRHPAQTDNLLSPEHAYTLPNIHSYQQSRTPIVNRRSFDYSSTSGFENNTQSPYDDRPRNQYPDDNYYKQGTPIVRSSPQMQYSYPQPQSGTTPRIRRSFNEFPAKPDFQEAQRNSLHDRRSSKESAVASSEEERSIRHHSTSRRSTMAVKDSPYTSSAEESPRFYGRRNEQGSGSEQKKSRRRSSHKKERPRLQGFEGSPRPDTTAPSAIDGSGPKYHRCESGMKTQQHPITPLSGDFSRTEMEDYFANAFRANDLRWSQKAYTPRSSGSALASPLTSPPRTPRSERQGKEYFDLTPTNARPVQHSRPPSVDEGQIRDPRLHGSLLSAATAGAAVAARTVEITSKAQSASLEYNKQTSSPHSGRPSPVQEESLGASKNAVHSRAGSFGLGVDRGLLVPGHNSRPVSRGMLNADEHLDTSVKLHPHAHRSLSYSTPDHVQPWNVIYPASAGNLTPNTNVATDPDHASRPQPRSARSSVNITDTPTPATSIFGLPICPRSRPVAGYNDWYTIKEMSNLDICPTCANIIANSRYHNLLVSSLPRPYNEPSVCAMSKPWVRVAFVQSRRQKQPDLRYIRDVTKPSTRPPCVGGKKDVTRWFYVIDPRTREPLPGFNACQACVELVDYMFPDVGSVFYRPSKGLSEERRCGLHTESKYFQSIVDQLEQLSQRCGRRWRSADTEDLVRHLRKVARYQPCTRDELQTSRAWHFMVDLPEFSMCEDCYDEVVRPVHDWPIARNITHSLKTVPVQRGTGGDPPLSCQLYSERMRKIFREAVESRNFALLRDEVKARVSMQQRLDAINKLYEQDLRYGIDRRQEIEKNQAIWRSIE